MMIHIPTIDGQAINPKVSRLLQYAIALQTIDYIKKVLNDSRETTFTNKEK